MISYNEIQKFTQTCGSSYFVSHIYIQIYFGYILHLLDLRVFWPHDHLK